ncbi:MAG: hypothetical protein K6F98_00445 [Bacteroidales bacterium]|nr:hypothetical protein [Bacteroidales bacterium]
MKNFLKVLPNLIQYNLKVIFGSKFIWFILAALAFFIIFMINGISSGEVVQESMVYSIMFFPGILLIFYPTVYCMQSDEDTRILEILFCIPNYRYKVWLFRLVMVYFIFYIFLVLFSYLATYLLYPVEEFTMAAQMMFPLLFLGNMAFMMSTFLKSGNATAVVMIVLGILFVTMGSGQVYYNLQLNPFDPPSNMHELLWSNLLLKNRLFLAIGAVIFLLMGLLNLQKRERFV